MSIEKLFKGWEHCWAAFVATWKNDDVGTQTVAEKHVWFCGPAAAKVCVDVSGSYCHQLLRRSWGLSWHWGNFLCLSATLILGLCQSGWLVMPARAMLTSWPCLLPGSMSWSVVVHVATKGHTMPRIWATTSDKVVVKGCQGHTDLSDICYQLRPWLVWAKLQPGQYLDLRLSHNQGLWWFPRCLLPLRAVQISMIWATTWGVGVQGPQSHWIHAELSDPLCQSEPWWYPGPGFGQGQCLGLCYNHCEGLCFYPWPVLLPGAMEQLGSRMPPRTMLVPESSATAGAIHIWAACVGAIGHGCKWRLFVHLRAAQTQVITQKLN